jgi:hypothetical protein
MSLASYVFKGPPIGRMGNGTGILARASPRFRLGVRLVL